MKWHASVLGVEQAQERIRQLEAENSGLTLKLKHARGQLSSEVDLRIKLEQEREEQVTRKRLCS
jgi:hypothetical protein